MRDSDANKGKIMVAWSRVKRCEVIPDIESGRPIVRAFMAGQLSAIYLRGWDGKWRGWAHGTWELFVGIPF